MPAIPILRLRRLLALLVLAGALPALPVLPAAQAATALPAAEEAWSPVLLPRNYNDAIDPAGYWVSEKLDGVRALWDGKTLRFRSGRLIHAPAWFTAALPPHPLDGELWSGRGEFATISATVRRQVPDDAEWRRISYQVFEWPGAPGTFTQRLAALRESIGGSRISWLKLRPQYRVADRGTLQAKLREVIALGGEGLVLHRADAAWQTGRSEVLLKLKPQPDAEATVIGYLPGRGKYSGLCGALRVRTPDGREFRIGSGLSDADRAHPPAIGSVVTYRYRGNTSHGLPRFATFLRVRPDE